MNIYNFIIATEMLLANVYVTHICSKKRFPLWKTIGIFLVSYLFFVALFWAIRTNLPPIPNGSGILLFTGFLFIIPLFLVYNQDIRFTLLIMCLSWLYTTILFSMSLILANIIDRTMLLLLGSIIQTVLLITTYPMFVSYIKNKLFYIMIKMERNTLHLLIVLTFLAFMIVVFHHIQYFIENISFFPFIIIILIAVFIVLLYQLFYLLASSNKKMVYLKKLINKEWLAQLKGQEELKNDLVAFEKNQMKFMFINLKIELDINRKKSNLQEINATCQFAQIVSGLLPFSATLYRIDENQFVILQQGTNAQSIISEINSIRFPGLEEVRTRLVVYSYPNDKNDVLHFVSQFQSS